MRFHPFSLACRGTRLERSCVSCASASRSNERGVVQVEVVMALIPILLIFFGICQISLLYAAKMVVQHAATRAARAAIVVLEDHPDHYDGTPRGDLLADSGSESSSGAESGSGHSSSTTSESSSQPLDSTQGTPPEATGKAKDGLVEAYSSLFSSSSDDGEDETKGGPRWNAIRAAAYHPLAVLAPSIESLFGKSLKSELSQGALTRIIGGRFFYNLGAASVTLHAPGSDEVLTKIESREQILVRVAFLMPCGVPMVSRLICSSREDFLASIVGLNDRAQEMSDKTEHVESTMVRDGIFLAVPHLILLTADAIMPNQGANYYD